MAHFKKWRAISLSALCLLLASCAQPTTMSAPGVTQAELAAEQIYQENYLKDEKAKGLVYTVNKKPVLPRLEAAAKRIAPAAVDLCRELKLYPDPRDCAYGIFPSKGKDAEGNSKINAYADGKAVYINNGMVRFTEDDNELAYVLAHEFAHNIMKHIDAKKQNAMAGIFLGALADGIAARYGGGTSSKGYGMTDAGAQAGALAYSPAFEQEADYIGLYLIARAGYDYHHVADVWRRMSLQDRESIYYASTHPSNAERFVLMRKFIAEIDAKKAAKAPLFPEFKPAKG